MGQHSIAFRHQFDFHNSRRSRGLAAKRGINVEVRLRRDNKGHLRASMPKEALRRYLGEVGCIYAIEAKGRVVYRWYNPSVTSYEKEVPNYLGEAGERVSVTIWKVSTTEFIEAANRGGLPFVVKIGVDGKSYILVGSHEIPAKATGVHWGGGGNIACVSLTIKDVAGSEHLIKVRYKGYEPPEAVLTRRSGIRLIVDVHYVDLRDTLVVVYRRGVGEKVSRHEIRLSGPNIEKIKGYLSERGLLDSNVINMAVEKYNTVIGYNIEDARRFGFLEKGLYGEWRIVYHDAERVIGIKGKPRDEHGKHIVEVDVLETDRLVDAKFWDERTFRVTFIYKDRRYLDSISRMLKYKKAMEIYHKNKVYVIFIDKIDEKVFEEGKHNILEELTSRVGNTSWIEIVNGLNGKSKFDNNITTKVQES